MIARLLPAGFESLEPFVPRWAAPSLGGRDQARLDSTPDERQAFYSAAAGLLGPAVAHLDAKELAAFDAAEHRLMNLVLSLAHVALAVELQGVDEPMHARGARMMPIRRGHADPSPPPQRLNSQTNN